MENIPKNISYFLHEQHILALATINESHQSYSSPVFYLYDNDKSLIFHSSSSTLHSTNFMTQPAVSGSIYSQAILPEDIQGIQLLWKINKVPSETFELYYQLYCDKFDFLKTSHKHLNPMLQQSEFWQLNLTYLKFTNNKVKFGHKEYWEYN